MIRVKKWTGEWMGGLAFLLLAAPRAQAEYVLHFWENREAEVGVLSVSDEVSLLSSTQYFDANGDLISPAGFNRYLRIENNLHITYGWTPRWSVFGTLSWGRVDLDQAYRPGTSYGLTDQIVGTHFELLSFDSPSGTPSPVAPEDTSAVRKLYLQAQVSFPGYSNTTADANWIPRLGDQSIDATAGVFGVLRLMRNASSDLLLTLGAGYTYRSAGFSSAVPWSVSFQYAPSSYRRKPSSAGGSLGFLKGWQLDLSALGSYSLQTDTRSTVSPNGIPSSFVPGGNFLSGAINPSLTTVRGQVAYALEDDLLFSLSATQTVWGRSAAHGFSAALGIQKLFGLSPTRKSRAQMGPEEYGKSNRGFIQYTFEAKVLRSVDRLNLVKIDKGHQDGVSQNQIFDIFTIQPDGTLGEPVARGKVISTKPNEAALTVLEYFKETWIEEGYIAKRPIQ